MAIDEAITDSVMKKLSPPTLRIYQWSEPSISIGYFQKFSDLNLDYCRERGYPFVRRVTGGTAILHGLEMTYSFSSRNDCEPFRGGLLQNYFAISSAIVASLNALKLDAALNMVKNKIHTPLCFSASSYGEVTVNGKKVVGSAQKKYREGFLQQGTFLMKADRNELLKILSPDSNCYDVSGIGLIQECDPSVSMSGLKKVFVQAVKECFGARFVPEGITGYEHQYALQLVNDKYSKDKWNFRR
jgi:lipoate-protein ligase A